MDKKKIYFVLITVILVLAKLGSYVLASEIDTLRGLKGVRVIIVVQYLDYKGEKGRLTKDQIQLDVELKLRLAGIKMLSEKEWREEEGNPSLHVGLHIQDVEKLFKNLNLEEKLYFSYITIELYQDVYLRRNPSIEEVSATWTTGGFSWGSLNHIRNSLKNSIDIFLNDYLTVNPRFQKEEQPNPLDGLFQKNKPRNLIKEMEEEKRLQELEEKSIPTPEEYRRQHK